MSKEEVLETLREISLGERNYFSIEDYCENIDWKKFVKKLFPNVPCEQAGALRYNIHEYIMHTPSVILMDKFLYSFEIPESLFLVKRHKRGFFCAVNSVEEFNSEPEYFKFLIRNIDIIQSRTFLTTKYNVVSIKHMNIWDFIDCHDMHRD